MGIVGVHPTAWPGEEFVRQAHEGSRRRSVALFAMKNSLLSLQIECDRAARELLALPSWGSQRRGAYEAVNAMTFGGNEAPSAMAWLIDATGRLPPADQAVQKLHQLVNADAALHEYRNRPEAKRELYECDFPSRVRADQKVA